MKTLYFDCGMGAAGDMLMASLYEICPDKAGFLKTMNEMGLPGLSVEAEPAVKCGITGTHMKVTIHGEEEESVDVDLQKHVHDHTEHHEHANDHHEHCHDHEVAGNHHHHETETHHHEMAADMADNTHIHAYDHDHQPDHDHHDEHDFHHTHTHEETHTEEDSGHPHHHHASMAGITHIIEHLNLPDEVKKDVVAVYHLIAEAESHVHGKTVEEIHFHEVGTMDAIADITAVCLLMNKIAPDQVIVSPVHVGSGHVHCAHGILPVPAPATAYILNGVPMYGGAVKGELCTPTGAALLKHFATRFGDMPVMRTEAIGYGMGKKDFEQANCIRAMLGETEDAGDSVLQLECNVDDMTAEELGFAMEAILAAGALEVYTVAAGMKKSRPGTILCVLCHEDAKETLVRVIFRNTTTIGVREHRCSRYTLKRSFETVQTPYGDVQKKLSSGYGVTREKYEYEDLARIAREQGLSLAEVRKGIAHQ